MNRDDEVVSAGSVAAHVQLLGMNASRRRDEPATFGHHAASSGRDELMVGAFGDVVPGADQRLELREGRVHLRAMGVFWAPLTIESKFLYAEA